MMSKITSQALKNDQQPSEDTNIVCSFSGLTQQLRALADCQGARVSCPVRMQSYSRWKLQLQDIILTILVL